MRRISSRQQEEKKRRRSQIMVGSVLIFVLFFSVLGFGFINHSSSGGSSNNNQNNENNSSIISIMYNGFRFTEQNGFWSLNQNKTNFIFRNNPNEVENISSKIKLLEDYKKKDLYIYSKDIFAESEIRTNLIQFTNKIKDACLKECEEGYPIKTCKDNFIIVKIGRASCRERV